MATAEKTTARTRTQATGERTVFAYSVAPERIRALASTDFADIDRLTIFSPKRLPGLRSRKLKRIALPGGKEAVTVAVDAQEDVGVPADTSVPEFAFAPGARARAILRGIEHAYADLHDAGGAYDLSQVRRVMRGISRQAVDKRTKEGSLLAVPGPSNHRSYPTLQFNSDGSVVDGLKAVYEALPTRNPWAVLNFLVNPQSSLAGAKPIERLRAGAIDEVVAAANRIGEQGA